jgi:hypothetical protein
VPSASATTLLGASNHRAPEPRPVLDHSLARLARTLVAALRASGSWATGIPPNHATRNCEAYDVVAEPLETGAAFRVSFDGTLVYLWAMGRGAIETMVEGSGVRDRVEINSGSEWSFHTISPVQAGVPHVLEVTALELPLVLGDLYIIGRLLGSTAVPDMVK